MRSLILLGFFSSYMITVFMKPFIGVLLWIWIAVGTPHLETYGISRSLQLNLVVAVVTLFYWIAYKKKADLYKTPTAILIYVMIVLMIISTSFGENPNYSSSILSRVIKIMVLAFVMMGMIDNRIRVHACVWLLAVSLGYYSVKAGVGTIASGGSFRVSGPAGGPIGDNNHTAAAFIMLVPLLNYLRLESEKRFVRMALTMAILFTLIGIVGTYSRGGFIGVTSMIGFYWIRSKGKFRNALILVLLGVAFAGFIPEKYYNRLNTIESADEEDKSFRERLGAWQTAINIAGRRPLGVGFRAYELSSVFGEYKEPDFWREAMAMHSMYFEILADLGYIGLAMYLIICISVWMNLLWIMRHTKGRADLKWAHTLASMLEISFAGFAVAGAALSMAWFEPLWILIAIALIVRAIVERQLAKETAAQKVAQQTSGSPGVGGMIGGTAPAE